MCLNLSTIWYYFPTFVCSQQNDVSGDTIEFSPVSVNHKQCEDVEDEDPPPLPPRRGESLKRPYPIETEPDPTNIHGTQVLPHEQLGDLLIVGWFLVLPGMAFVVFAH
jgi:hypothetical protein